jgi:hypothetical protein
LNDADAAGGSSGGEQLGRPWPSVHVGIDRGIADGPARCAMCGAVGHNGYLSQSRCIQPGEWSDTMKCVVYRRVDCSKIPRKDFKYSTYKKKTDAVSFNSFDHQGALWLSLRIISG